MSSVSAIIFATYTLCTTWASCFPNPQPGMHYDNDFPRIEVYTEKDKGDPDAGNNQWTDPNGKTVYGGARDYQPHIVRTTIRLDAIQKKALQELTMTFLPYFREQRTPITVGQYAEASRSADREAFRKMFPASLEGLYSYKDNTSYPFFDTRLLYQVTHPSNITVVWLDENTWIVDHMYYRIENLDQLVTNVKQEETELSEGEFEAFLRYSPLFQAKLHEGFTELTPEAGLPVLPSEGLVFSYSLSPGMPNTTSYTFELSADGTLKYSVNGLHSVKQLDADRITTLCLHTFHLNWERYESESASRPSSQDHDRQQVSITVWSEGKSYRLRDVRLESDASPLGAFMKFVLEFFAPELQRGKW